MCVWGEKVINLIILTSKINGSSQTHSHSFYYAQYFMLIMYSAHELDLSDCFAVNYKSNVLCTLIVPQPGGVHKEYSYVTVNSEDFWITCTRV